MSAIALRVATTADLDTLYPLTHALNTHEDIHLEESSLRASLGRLLGDPALGQIWLVERDGATVGYALVSFAYDLEFGGREGWLTEIWIAEPHRAAGVGSTVIALLEPELRALDVLAVHLQVRPENPARRLYERLGFVASPRIVMTRRLLNH